MTDKMPSLDLFGDALPTVKGINDRPEAAALVEVLKTLRAHPMVTGSKRAIPFIIFRFHKRAKPCRKLAVRAEARHLETSTRTRAREATGWQ